MRLKSVLRRVVGVEKTVVEGVNGEDAEGLVIDVRPYAREKSRCPHCGRRCPVYDRGGGRRRWRTLDLGTVKTWLEADAPRVTCKEHGVVVARVPWARPGSGFTRSFEAQTAWLATKTDKTTVSKLMRIAWRSVGRIVERVCADARRQTDGLDGLRRIGIDEVSYRRGHRYLTVIVDHDTGRLVWAGEGKSAATIAAFFQALGPERAAQLELVSADAWSAVVGAIKKFCAQATLCLDPFHIVKWCTDALDVVRRDLWNRLRRGGASDEAITLKRSRYALWKNPDKLTEHQREKLGAIARFNKPLYRAYLLKEQLREVFRLKGDDGVKLLDRWLAWACRSRLKPFVKLSRRIRKHRAGIEAALTHSLSNARLEAANTKVRLITRLAFGFKKVSALIALIMLRLGGLCPDLPGRP